MLKIQVIEPSYDYRTLISIVVKDARILSYHYFCHLLNAMLSLELLSQLKSDEYHKKGFSQTANPTKFVLNSLSLI